MLSLFSVVLTLDDGLKRVTEAIFEFKMPIRYKCIKCNKSWYTYAGARQHVVWKHTGQGEHFNDCIKQVSEEDSDLEFESADSGGEEGEGEERDEIMLFDSEEEEVEGEEVESVLIHDGEEGDSEEGDSQEGEAKGFVTIDPIKIFASKLNQSVPVLSFILQGVADCLSNVKAAKLMMRLHKSGDVNFAAFDGEEKAMADKVKYIKDRCIKEYHEYVALRESVGGEESPHLLGLPAVRHFSPSTVTMPSVVVAHGKVLPVRKVVVYHRDLRQQAIEMLHEVVLTLGKEHVHLQPERPYKSEFGPRSRQSVREITGAWSGLWWEELYAHLKGKEENKNRKIGLLPLVIFVDKAASGTYPGVLMLAQSLICYYVGYYTPAAISSNVLQSLHTYTAPLA
jgi:hypothetical protein